MSRSSLVDVVVLSPNCTKPRNKKISKITIHHMAGSLTAKQCGNVFKPTSRKASSNYGIGSDGKIGLYVDEENRAWTSSSPSNDHMAVTIEVANDGGAPQWHVSDKALEATIELCADICRRNGIKELKFTGNAKGNLTMHRYFANTNCPGPYLESKFPYIAEEVNKRIKSTDVHLPNLKTVNDIVWELHHRGIITDKLLWLDKCDSEQEAYNLAFALANKTVNSIRPTALKTENDIAWELGHRKLISDTAKWLRIIKKDKNLYWLAYKTVNMTKNVGDS